MQVEAGGFEPRLPEPRQVLLQVCRQVAPCSYALDVLLESRALAQVRTVHPVETVPQALVAVEQVGSVHCDAVEEQEQAALFQRAVDEVENGLLVFAGHVVYGLYAD